MEAFIGKIIGATLVAVTLLAIFAFVNDKKK